MKIHLSRRWTTMPCSLCLRQQTTEGICTTLRFLITGEKHWSPQFLWAHDHLEKFRPHLILNNNTPRFGDELWCGKPLVWKPMYCKSIPYQVVTTVAFTFHRNIWFSQVDQPNCYSKSKGGGEPDYFWFGRSSTREQQWNPVYFCNSSWDSQHNQY